MLSKIFASTLLIAASTAAPWGSGSGHGGPPGGHPGWGPPHGPSAPLAPASSPQPWGYFVNSTIYQPTGNEGLFYPRYTELEDGTILATTSLSGPVPDYFPVFESTDGGASWTYISNLTDQVNGLGFTAQPALHELTFDLGAYKKGTILGGGNSWGNTSTNIDLYASTDRGRTWEFVSHVANGGPPNTTNGATPVWEPYFLPYDGEVIAYYSDQRDPLHGQKLAHQTSKDLVNWGPIVNDVAYDNYLARPGMTIVAYIPPIDKWMLVHENPVVLANGSVQYTNGVQYPVFYKLATDPRDFASSPDLPLLVNGTIAPSSSPYVVWTPEPKGSKYGTIVVSDNDHRSVFTNQAGGTEDSWEEHGTPAGAVYSRAIEIFQRRSDHLLIYGGDTFNGLMEGDQLPFSATVLDINWVLEKAPEDYSVS
ncbi:hypothetical protein LTR56_002508 [Elasticomyces elasticus]|uniref:Glycoside hydrolase family 93 protein n=1 Tax=Elasticomyces elasticus TaxID=574655 RepID=A0AAN7WFI5_9PEZI|nr:hypothetical protein LTR22_020197 [Elasticomyces elasticus]KAK3657366.1 hypothetical protein LTR56_002508 [Elasticomyces elasticus]KAK4933560.1 hypothetical protein LTR49_000022 [Elasticomyces elasticus]KAK5705193.1 hypothetical protein LTR97_002310 [Elasticomyces elasticus]KAK5712846.1 hypothetical protein LTR15_011839 [Elasticomyces elasticus]